MQIKMFDLKCVFLIQIIVFRNSFLCQVINEINFHNVDDAFIELAFASCESNCSLSGLRLLILEEDSNHPRNIFSISDVIILDNITTNEHGLFTIGRTNNSQLQHQLKYNFNSLHGLALLHVDSEHKKQNRSIAFDRYLFQMAIISQNSDELS